MIWYEIHHSVAQGTWDVYKVTNNGQCYRLCKVLKTETAVRNFSKTHWVRRRTEA